MIQQENTNAPSSESMDANQHVAVSPGQQFSILETLLTFMRHKRLVGITAGCFLLIGIIVAVVSPSTYTVTARVIRESETNVTSTLSNISMLQGLGINFGGGVQGITVETYPSILRSREVYLSVANHPFYFSELDTTISLLDYFQSRPFTIKKTLSSIKEYTIGLPGKLLRIVKGEDEPEPGSIYGDSTLIFPTEEEEEALEWLSESLEVRVDRSSGIMSIEVTATDPLLSVQLAQALVLYLRERVREIYSQKAQENFDFLQARFFEVRDSLEIAESQLARFLDQNLNPQTARLRTELERLQRKTDFIANLYSEIQTQLTQAEIDLQRSKPVVTLVEAPVPPLERSGPKRKLIVFLSLFIGLGVAVGVVIIKYYLEQQEQAQEAKTQLNEIRNEFTSLPIIKWFKRNP